MPENCLCSKCIERLLGERSKKLAAKSGMFVVSQHPCAVCNNPNSLPRYNVPVEVVEYAQKTQQVRDEVLREYDPALDLHDASAPHCFTDKIFHDFVHNVVHGFSEMSIERLGRERSAVAIYKLANRIETSCLEGARNDLVIPALWFLLTKISKKMVEQSDVGSPMRPTPEEQKHIN